MEEVNGKCLNSARVCRFCLSQAGVMSSIFDQNNAGNNLPLPSKIMSFTRIQLFVNDGLPSLLCHRCLYMAEKAFDFKNQCEASDAMLREYLSVLQSRSIVKTEPQDVIPFLNGESTCNYSMAASGSINAPPDLPIKRKRGRPRKEENLIFYSSPVPQDNDHATTVKSNEVKIVDGIESLVTVVDPRSEILNNSDEEAKREISDLIDREKMNADTAKSLAIARAKAKKYMGVLVHTDEQGMRTRKHLCKGCGKTFGHCSDLRKHVLVHTGERPFHCQLCTKTFSRSTNLNKHLKVHTGQKPFRCPKCPKSFTSKGDLQRHSVIHSGIKPFHCNQCQQCFSRKDKLTRHLKLHEQNYESNESEEQLNSGHHVFGVFEDSIEDYLDPKGDWEEEKGEDEESSEGMDDSGHATNNDDVESMVINIDPFSMENEGQDTGGEEKVRGDSPKSWVTVEDCGLQCLFCTRVCNDEDEMRRHLLNHTMDRPYKCKLCSKSFTRRRELLRHEHVHTGLKPHKCSICEKAFARKDKLVRHLKIHSDEKTGSKLFCHFCNIGFYKQHLYDEHIATHHALHKEFGDDESDDEGNGQDGSEAAVSDDEPTHTKPKL